MGDLVARRSTRRDKVHFPQRTSFKLAEEMLCGLYFSNLHVRPSVRTCKQAHLFSLFQAPEKMGWEKSEEESGHLGPLIIAAH